MRDPATKQEMWALMQVEPDDPSPHNFVAWLIEALGMLAFVVGAVWLVVNLAGCAAVEKPICAMRLIGQTHQADPVVEMHCITEEQFKEAQK